MKKKEEAFIFRDDLHIESTLENDDEASLRQGIEETENEIQSLKAEIYELSQHLAEKEKRKAALSENLEKFTSPKLEIKLLPPRIHPGASTEERVALAFSLFHGRRDAYAARYIRKDDGSVGYSPVCMNRFREGCLLKLPKDERKNRTCLDCEERKLEALTPEIYYNRNIRNTNPKGADAVGIYAMLPENVCRFLAIDLDENTWQHDALEIADIARRDGFQMALERSFSGNGAHLWLFFSDDVPAVKARELAFSFIDKACERSKAVSLKSYDRIFPTQDAVTDGGLGNLILMPLVRAAALRDENPGTVFVDNSFRKYPDQISFLSSLPLYSRRDVETYLVSPQSSSSSSFRLMPFSDEDTDVLWRNRLPSVSAKDLLTKELPVYLSAGLSIPKAALSARLENGLKRLACFTNPEYFIQKKRNKGYIPEGTRLFIETFIESGEVLQLPRGLKSALERYLSQSEIPYRLIENRAFSTGLDAVFNGELRDEQKEAFEALKTHDIGILQAATSFGKTVVSAKLIAERKEKTLILVQSRNLLDQWKKKLGEFLTINNPPVKRPGKHLNTSGIGLYGSTTDSLTGYVDIAMIQTLSKRMPPFIRDYGLVIVDECHHLAADSFIKVANAVRPRYIYGLSATVERKDNQERAVYAQCGNVIYRYTADRLAYRRGMSQILVPRFTSATSPSALSSRFRNDECQKDIAFDSGRNSLIVSDIASMYEKGKRILVLTHLVDHTAEIGKGLEEKGIPFISVNGSTAPGEKKEALSRIADPENTDVVISTGQFLGEGTDIPYLDTLFIAAPVSWKGIVSQYVGRISREYEGKNEICIFDYVDIFIPAFAAMYNKRLRTYQSLGYTITQEKPAETAAVTEEKSFYSEDDVYPVLKSLVKNASQSIVISSPKAELNYGSKGIIEDLAEAVKRGVKVEVRTSTDTSPDALLFLKEKGITVTGNPNCYLKYAVFDTRSFLFGEVSILEGHINIRPGEKKLLENYYRVMILVNDPNAARALTEPDLFF